MSGQSPADVTSMANGDDGSQVAWDQTVVARCRAGDASAYTALYRRYAGEIHRHLRVLLGFSCDAEDATQAVFVTAFQGLHRYDSQRKLSSWLHGIAVRVALNARRSQRRRGQAMTRLEQSGLGPRRHTDPEIKVSSRARLVALEEHLASVNDKKRVAFLLYYVEQQDLAEVARRVGATQATTWARIKSARDAVILAMQEEHEQESRK